MTMSTAPMASAGMTPAAAGMTVQPTVRTRKKVPINSAKYFLILVFWIERCVQKVCRKFLYRNGVERGSYIYDRQNLAVIRHSDLSFAAPMATNVFSPLTLSLTPCFSWVVNDVSEGPNRFSGFFAVND